MIVQTDNPVFPPIDSNISDFDIFNNPYFEDYQEFFNGFNHECNYFNENEFKNNFKDNLNNFYAISLNVCSLGNKFLKLKTMLDNLKSSNSVPDLLAFQEVWQHDMSSLSLPGYNLHHNLRPSGRRGGGVCFYLNSAYNGTVLKNESLFIESTYESLVLKVNIPTVCEFICVSLYRPPNSIFLTDVEHNTTFFEQLIIQIEMLEKFNLPIIYFTDSNLDLFKVQNNPNTAQLCEIFSSYSYLTFISKCTRELNGFASCIDQIWSTLDPSRVIKLGIGTDTFSDHFYTSIIFKLDSPRKAKKNDSSYRKMSTENIDRFKDSLASLNWNSVTELESTDAATDSFLDIFNTLFDLHFPLIVPKPNKRFTPLNPFMSAELLIHRQKNFKLSKLAKAKPTAENKSNYKNFRNFYNSSVRTAKRDYYFNKFQLAGSDSRLVWKLINELRNQPAKNSSVDSLVVDDVLITDEKDIADAFNDHFASIGAAVAETVPTTDINFREFLTNPICNSLFLQPVSPAQITEAIRLIANKPSTDVNEISFKLIHSVAAQVSKPICHMYNLSISSGIFPASFKISKVIPIFKSGNSKQSGNYRGIALVNSFSKIFEKLVSDRLISFLSHNNFFFKDQYGFLKGRNTAQAVYKVCNFVSDTINKSEVCLAIFLDIRKAFDTVDHQILFAKLESAGVHGLTLAWFKSFMSDRKQQVKVGNSLSSNFRFITIGVLQGSILGVILFIIFLNDIGNAAKELSKRIFADDTTGLIKAKDIPTLVSKANPQIDCIVQWFSASKLAIHPDKTKVMLFHSPFFNLNINNNLPIYMNLNNAGESDQAKIKLLETIPNETESSIKMLGVLIDQKFNFADHINHINGKISKALYSLKQVKIFLRLRCRKLVYSAHVQSHLNYIAPVLAAGCVQDINALAAKQRKCIIIAAGGAYNADASNIFK